MVRRCIRHPQLRPRGAQPSPSIHPSWTTGGPRGIQLSSKARHISCAPHGRPFIASSARPIARDVNRSPFSSSTAPHIHRCCGRPAARIRVRLLLLWSVASASATTAAPPDLLQFGPPRLLRAIADDPLKSVAPAVHSVMRGGPLRLCVRGQVRVLRPPDGTGIQEIRPSACARRRQYASYSDAPPPVAPTFSRPADARRLWAGAAPRDRLRTVAVFSGRPRTRS